MKYTSTRSAFRRALRPRPRRPTVGIYLNVNYFIELDTAPGFAGMAFLGVAVWNRSMESKNK